MLYIWHRETETSCMYPESNQWLTDYICAAERAVKETQEVGDGELWTKSQFVTPSEVWVMFC